MKNYYSPILAVLLLVAGSLTAQDYTSLLKSNLMSSRSSEGMTTQDLKELTIYNQSTNRRSGVEHVYAIQKHNGVEIFNAVISAAFRGEELIHTGDNLQVNIASRVRNNTPVLTPIQAATSAASLLGAGKASFTTLKTKSSQEVVLDKGGVSLDDVPVKLVYHSTEENELRLAWDLSIHMPNGENLYSVRVDADNGEILSQHDWIFKCSFGDHSQKTANHTTNHKSKSLFGFSEETSNTALAGEQYNVFALPLQNPLEGPNTIVTDPQDLDASPFGWHDIDGVEGAEFTITRGNNVWALDDIADDNNETIGMSPDGGEDLIFDFEYDFVNEPENMIEAVTTNLFYINNVVHDVMYHYGFDEESGNFQETNYSGEGFGSDAVVADAQDGSGRNNATFFTRPEGADSRMQMFLWNQPTPTETLRITGGNLDGNYTGPPASFGSSIPGEGDTPITTNLILVEDDNSGGESTDTTDACDVILNSAEIAGNIVIMRRGLCQFSEKVLAGQNAGAIAVIVVNNIAGPPFTMTPGIGANEVTIPSIMVSQSDGEALIGAIENGESIEAAIGNQTAVTRDSALDNIIVIHEYGHGISARLIGGAFNSNCQFFNESRTEAWSDYFALMLTMTEDDEAEDPRGIAVYSSGQGDQGIRLEPYSTSFAINGLTYGITNDDDNVPVPHGIGSVWTTVLWDITWFLIDEYGFDADLYNGTGGNNIALQLAIDALKMEPCNSGFVDGRDAYLAAVEINTMIPEEDRDEMRCNIFEVFAGRGLGVGAEQGSPFSRKDQVESFLPAPLSDPNDPSSCALAVLSTQGEQLAENNFSVFPNPSNGQVSLNMKSSLGEGKVQIIDLNGRVVFTQNNLLEGTINIDAEGLSTGVYLLEVSNATVSEATKLIIK